MLFGCIFFYLPFVVFDIFPNYLIYYTTLKYKGQERIVIIMKIIRGLFKSRDKPSGCYHKIYPG